MIVTFQHKCSKCIHKVAEWGFSDSVCNVWNEMDQVEQLHLKGSYYDDCSQFEMTEEAFSLYTIFNTRGW